METLVAALTVLILGVLLDTRYRVGRIDGKLESHLKEHSARHD